MQARIQRNDRAFPINTYVPEKKLNTENLRQAFAQTAETQQCQLCISIYVMSWVALANNASC